MKYLQLLTAFLLLNQLSYAQQHEDWTFLFNGCSFDFFDISDEDVLSVITFLKNAFVASSDFGGADLTTERIQDLRKLSPLGGGLFTEAVLDSIFNNRVE